MNALKAESVIEMNKYKKILDKRSEHLKEPEVSYHELIGHITSPKNREPFEKRLHERTMLCHPPPVYFQRRREGYCETVKELLKYFEEKYEDYKEVVRIYERRQYEAEMRIRQEEFKKEAERMREVLKRKEIEKELSQIDFTKLTEAYMDLCQIDFTKREVVYADLDDIAKLATL